MNPLDNLGSGFKDAIGPGRDWNFGPEIWAMLAVTALIIFLSTSFVDSIIIRYRNHIRARRREMKKRLLLSRMLYDKSAGGSTETEMLRRLIRYYTNFYEDSGQMNATPEQLLSFSQTLFQMMRQVEFDKRGKLVIPAMEKKLADQASAELPGMDKRSAPKPTFHGNVWRGMQASGETMSKAGKVTLNLIRMRKQDMEPEKSKP